MKYIAKGILEYDNAKGTLEHDNANAAQIHIGNHIDVSFLFFFFFLFKWYITCLLHNTKQLAWGASTVKYMEKMLRYTKIIMFLVKRLKVVAKCYLNWIFFMPPSLFMLSTQI